MGELSTRRGLSWYLGWSTQIKTSSRQPKLGVTDGIYTPGNGWLGKSCVRSIFTSVTAHDLGNGTPNSVCCETRGKCGVLMSGQSGRNPAREKPVLGTLSTI